MKLPAAVAIAACAVALTGVAASAAETAPAAVLRPLAPTQPAETDEPASGRAAEPAIRSSVIEDRGVRIEELRVRGQLLKVTVDPKGGAPGYEILLGDGVHAFADDPGTSRGSAGKRVWNVLRF